MLTRLEGVTKESFRQTGNIQHHCPPVDNKRTQIFSWRSVLILNVLIQTQNCNMLANDSQFLSFIKTIQPHKQLKSNQSTRFPKLTLLDGGLLLNYLHSLCSHTHPADCNFSMKSYYCYNNRTSRPLLFLPSLLSFHFIFLSISLHSFFHPLASITHQPPAFYLLSLPTV